MDLILYIFLLAIGATLGFWWFYMQFQDRDMVNRLKNENQVLKSELWRVQFELKEYYQQNLILKDKTTSLLTQNDDYNKIVWELNRYYFHLKNWYEKAKELTEALKIFDKDFESKMSRIGQYIPTVSVDTSRLNPNNLNVPQSQTFVAAPVPAPTPTPVTPAQEVIPQETAKPAETQDANPQARTYITIDEDAPQNTELTVTKKTHDTLDTIHLSDKKFF